MRPIRPVRISMSVQNTVDTPPPESRQSVT